MEKATLIATVIVAMMFPTSQSAAANPSPAGEKFGGWTVQTVKDGFSDVTRGIAATSLNGQSAMVIKCDKQGPGSLYAQIFTPQFLGSDKSSVRYERHTAKYRLDDDAAVDFDSPYYDGRSALVFNREATRFVAGLALKNAKRFRGLFMTYDNDEVQVDIDISGVSDAIKRTAQICGDTTVIP